VTDGGNIMPADRTTVTLGARAYGLGVMAVGALGLAWGTFIQGQPVPKDLPGRALLAYAAAALMLIAGAAVEWRRTIARGAMALTAYYAVVVVVLMNGRVLLGHYAQFLTYEGLAIQLAITIGALLLYARAGVDAALVARLTRLCRSVFGLCALVFGAAHFLYFNLTAPLVPKWLPPSQAFWAYATGLCHMAAGVALLTGVQARLAVVLLTVMFASFSVLVHVPMLLADPSSHWIWSENAENLALTGAAWVMAESIARARR